MNGSRGSKLELRKSLLNFEENFNPTSSLYKVEPCIIGTVQRIEIASDEFYHIYNRGTEKRDIFLTRSDDDRFLALMYLCNGPKPVDLKLQGSTLYEVWNIVRGDP